MNNPFTNIEMTQSEYADFVEATIDANWVDNPYSNLFNGAKGIIRNVMWACYNEDCDALTDSIEDMRNYCNSLVHSDEVIALNDASVIADLNSVAAQMDNALSAIRN